MKLATYQELHAAATSRHASPREKAERQAALEQRVRTDPISGTVFVPVWFGCGSPRGEAVDLLSAWRGCSKRQAKNAIKAGTVECDNGATGYTRRDIAEAVGRDCVGMGSCTNYAVCESDPDCAYDCDISVIRGNGWRRT